MMSEPFDPQSAAHEMAQGIASMREIMAPLDEATLGYKAQLIETGWSPESAEDMAIQFFTMAMTQMMKAA